MRRSHGSSNRQSNGDARSGVSLRGDHQAVRRLHSGRLDRPRHQGGRVLHAARAERLRQDDDAADDRRLRGAERGRDPRRRRRRRRPARPQAPDQHGLPELRAVPASDGPRERRLRAQAQEGRQVARSNERVDGGARAGRARQRGEPQAQPALRRPAAARRARPRGGQPPEGAAARRAARRARPEAPQGPAARAEADPAGDRDHLRLRHPRPGGGADDVGPDRGHEPAASSSRSPSRSRSTSARRRPSSPGSSASRT